MSVHILDQRTSRNVEPTSESKLWFGSCKKMEEITWGRQTKLLYFIYWAFFRSKQVRKILWSDRACTKMMLFYTLLLERIFQNVAKYILYRFSILIYLENKNRYWFNLQIIQLFTSHCILRHNNLSNIWWKQYILQ